MNKWTKYKIQLDNKSKIPIQLKKSICLVSKEKSDGKPFPLFIVDFTHRQDVINAIENHKYAKQNEGGCQLNFIFKRALLHFFRRKKGMLKEKMILCFALEHPTP